MSNPKPFLRALVLTLAGAGVAPVLGSTPDQLPAQLKRCASLTVASARLACYDALAGSSVSNQAAPPTAAASNAASGGIAEAGGIAASTASTAPPVQGASHVQGAVPAQPDMEFGVHNGALEAKLVNPHREKQMLAVVRNVSNRPRGELVVTLDNGQVWAQIEATRYPLKPGDHVEIDVGAMGSYVLWSPSNRRATKVTRIS